MRLALLLAVALLPLQARAFVFDGGASFPTNKVDFKPQPAVPLNQRHPASEINQERSAINELRDAVILGARHGLQQQTATPPAPDGGLVHFARMHNGVLVESVEIADGGLADIANANGAIPSARVRSAVDYGVLPTNTDVQNTAGLAVMQADLIANPNTTVIFPAGTYQYDGHGWIAGVRNATLIGYGASLQNVDMSSPYDSSARDLTIGTDIWTGNAGGNGYLFSTAQPGATSITLVTSAQGANFHVGDRVLLHGYCQQGYGFPPNPRYFEYRRVKSVSLGTITFDLPISNFYDARWPDFTTGSEGEPRILNLEQSAVPPPDYIKLAGFTFLDSPAIAAKFPYFVTGGFGIIQIGGALDVELVDVKVGSAVPSGLRSLNLERVSVTASMEIDKVIHSVTIGDSHIVGMSGGTGCDLLSVQGSRIDSPASIVARVQRWDRCIFSNPATTSAILVASDVWSVRSVDVSASQAVYTAAQFSTKTPVLAAGQDVTLTVPDGGGGTYTPTDGGPEVAYVDAFTDFDALLNHVDYGTVLRSTDGNSARIQQIYGTAAFPDGGGVTRIEGDFRRVPQSYEQFTYSTTRSARADIKILNGGGDSLIVPSYLPATVQHRSYGHEEQRMRRRVLPLASLVSGYTIIDVSGYLDRVEVVVDQPAIFASDAGANTSASFQFTWSCFDVANTFHTMTFKPGTAGARFYTAAGYQGPTVSGESQSGLGVCFVHANSAILYAISEPYPDGGSGGPDPLRELPTGYIEIETVDSL